MEISSEYLADLLIGIAKAQTAGEYGRKIKTQRN